MGIARQLRRGTTSQHTTFTGKVAELTVDTSTKTLILHDGSTVGGIKQASQAFVLANASTPGVKGDTGDAGQSAYQLALANGFSGTLVDWFVSLKGVKGDKGADGTDGAGFVTAPTLAIGQEGDLQGAVAIDAGYLYYCYGIYDGITPIWSRTPLSGTW